jgi:hypothetical protein
MKGKINIFSIVLIIVFFFSIEAKGFNWEFYSTSKNEGVICYYDPQNRKRVSKNIVRVSTKEVYKGKGARDFIKTFGFEYKELSYTVSSWEFNFSEKKYRFLSLPDYNKDGGVIHSYTYDSPSCHFITPNSADETFLRLSATVAKVF